MSLFNIFLLLSGESSGLYTPAKKKGKKRTGSPSAGKILKKKIIKKKKTVDAATNDNVDKVKKKKINKDAGKLVPEKKVKKKLPPVSGDAVANGTGQQKKGRLLIFAFLFFCLFLSLRWFHVQKFTQLLIK